MIPKDITKSEKGLSDWAILIAYRGSIAHGMYCPPKEPTSVDDKDVMAVCVPPKEYYLGLSQYGSRGTKEIKKDEWDIVVYEAIKFVRLLAVGNPNVLSMLWLEPQHYLYQHDAGKYLIENRELFVAKHVYKSFAGYAHGQLHRMTHMAFKGYMGEKRKGLVEKFGYDTKNGAHLVRLLRMAIEFLNDGVLYVNRHDAQQLLEIKRGEWTLEQVKSEADRLFKLADEAYLKSKLPVNVDKGAISKMCVNMIELKLGG
jgi:predicted nucleotidyltransferase